MRFLLAPLAVLTILALPSVAHASDISTTFNVSATLTPDFSPTDGTGSVSGTITIDATLGTVTAVDLTYVYDGDTEIYTAPDPSGLTYYNGYTIVNLYSDTNSEYSQFQLNAANLVGFTSGSLCSAANPCPGNNASNFYAADSTIPNFSTASLTATPEPSSLALLGTGILSLAGAARRKLRKA